MHRAALILALMSAVVGLGCRTYELEGVGVAREPEPEAPVEPPAPESDLDAAPAAPVSAGEHPTEPSPAVQGVLPSFTDTRDEDAGPASSGNTAWPPHPQGNDLTAPCHRDDDCNYGACYVSGRGTDANPICSKRCSADADCPDGALCATPLDCTDGEGCDGTGYCFRACEADAECQAWNPLGVQRLADDDNPVVCVRWAAIYEEPRPPAIDICIQHSEP